MFSDLKSYFTHISSSRPITHESGVGQETLDEDVATRLEVEEIGTEVVSNEVETQLRNNEGVLGQGDAREQGIITEFNPEHIISDPGIRISIDRFAHDIRDEVKRAFIEKCPTQPTGHNFPKAADGRSFQKNWFTQYNWLEYSLVNDRAYCFYCYIFKIDNLDEQFGHDAFTKTGFKQWRNAKLIL